jgi:predicted site-specific integrase-resolvase
MIMKLLTAKEIAEVLGVTRQRAEQLHAEGKLPHDAETASGRPLWTPESAERFKAERSARREGIDER